MTRTCPRCGGALDHETGRHIDDDGVLMSYREDLIQCRQKPDIERLREIEERFGKAASSCVAYRGFDITSDA